MNRRGLLRIIPAGLISLARPISAAEPSHDDMWVKIRCGNKIDSEGKVFRKPDYWDINDAQYKVDKCKETYGKGNLTTLRAAEKVLEEAWLEHDTKMSKWKSLDTCNCFYKRLHGTHVTCPKCRELSIGFTGRDTGIVV